MQCICSNAVARRWVDATEIRKFPMLRPDQESAYAKRWREQGDREAAYHLVTSHLRLVAKIAMRYRGYGLPIADIIFRRKRGPHAGRETLRKIEFDSSKFITPEELDEIAKKYIGQDADISTLQQVVADINAIYAERGIVTGIATLPEQDAKEVRMKPHVICLMASSVDGRTLPSRWRPKGSAGNLFERVHDELAGDAWLVGRVTGQEFAKGKPYPASTSESFPREHWFARRDAQAYGVVLDAQGKIGWARSDIGGDPVLVVLSEKVSDAHLAGLRGDGVSYIFAGGSELDLALTLDILNRELGVKRLLLEGGGGANGAFLRAGLVDELHLIVCPAIDGAKGAPSVFDSTEAEAAQRAPVMAMTLESSQTLEGGAMLLRYRIQNEAPEAPASR